MECIVDDGVNKIFWVENEIYYYENNNYRGYCLGLKLAMRNTREG